MRSSKFWKPSRVLAIFAALTLGILAWSLHRSAVYQVCTDAQTYEPSDKGGEPPQDIPNFFDCFTAAIDANHDLVTALGTIMIAIFTGTLWWSTSGLLRVSNEQEGAIRKSAQEATRSATAMEGVAAAVAVSAQTGKEIAAQQKLVSEMQLRAYLSVVIGAAAYQDRPGNIRFSGAPLLVNNSPTPAFKITYVTAAAVLPVPLPPNFDWPTPKNESRGEDMIGPHQNRVLSVVLDDFVDDNEVSDIKVGRGKALYVWGTITYEDAFKNSRRTDFCHLLTWLPNGNVWGVYIPNRNNTT